MQSSALGLIAGTDALYRVMDDRLSAQASWQLGQALKRSSTMGKSNAPFRYFDSSSEMTRLVVMMCVKFQLSLRKVEDLLQPASEVARERPGRQ